MRRMIILALAAWPLVAWGQTPVFKCMIEGRTTYQGRVCPEGTMVGGWNLPEVAAPPSEPTPEQEAVAARLRARLDEAARGGQANADLPRLDATTRCRAVASVGGGYSASTFNACMSNEQEAYEDLGTLFIRIPAPIRERCLRVANVGEGGSYSTLQACLEQENRALASMPQQVPVERPRQGRVTSEQRRKLPVFDPEAHCEDYARSNGPRSAVLYNICIESQQKAYRKAASLFDQVSEGMQERCTDYANTSPGGSYVLFELCLHNQRNASRNPAKFTR
ncbi:hypothetical protein EQG41_20460 [Billgrantia azerbaijanica]|nr:hypothetical protein EQG41_20460 [Halomonas azerbaijanica]